MKKVLFLFLLGIIVCIMGLCIMCKDTNPALNFGMGSLCCGGALVGISLILWHKYEKNGNLI